LARKISQVETKQLQYQCDGILCRSPIDGEDNAAGLCCHLEEQVRALHTRVCEALQRKYSSVLRSDDHTAHLSNDVIAQFALVRPMFEHLEKVPVESVFEILISASFGNDFYFCSVCADVMFNFEVCSCAVLARCLYLILLNIFSTIPVIYLLMVKKI